QSMQLKKVSVVIDAAIPQIKGNPELPPSSTSPVPTYTGTPIVDLLRKLLRHQIESADREEKALTCLWNAIGHIPDVKERQELSWIGPKGDIRTPWTSAMEFFYLSDTGIEESTLREYLATFTVAMHLGHHPNAAITGNVAVVGRLVALNEAGFTSKLVEHLRQEFPDEMDAIAGAAPSKGESGKTLGEPANDDSQAVDEKQGKGADQESEEP